jgi:chloramphenicol 3-O-phosphotransferase
VNEKHFAALAELQATHAASIAAVEHATRLLSWWPSVALSSKQSFGWFIRDCSNYQAKCAAVPMTSAAEVALCCAAEARAVKVVSAPGRQEVASFHHMAMHFRDRLADCCERLGVPQVWYDGTETAEEHWDRVNACAKSDSSEIHALAKVDLVWLRTQLKREFAVAVSMLGNEAIASLSAAPTAKTAQSPADCLQKPAQAALPSPSPALTEVALMSELDIVEHYAIPQERRESFRQALKRYRQANPNDIESSGDRAGNQSPFLYRLSAVQSIVERYLPAPAATSS